MIQRHRLTALGLSCAALGLLLAGCGSSSSSSGSAPTLAPSLSTANFTDTAEIGTANQLSYYVRYDNATSESIASSGNPDNLQVLTMADTTGATGKITLALASPSGTTVAGIYPVTFSASNAYGTATQEFNFNIVPAGQLTGHPTIINFPMGGSSSPVTQTVSIGLRTGIIDASSQTVTLTAPAGSAGITLGNGTTSNGISVVQNGTADAGTISANITIDPATLTPSTVTDSSGNQYTKGIELILTALPETNNGYTPTPYFELVYINPT